MNSRTVGTKVRVRQPSDPGWDPLQLRVVITVNETSSQFDCIRVNPEKRGLLHTYFSRHDDGDQR